MSRLQAGAHAPPPALLDEVEVVVVADEVDAVVVAEDVEAVVEDAVLVEADEVPPDATAPPPLDETAPVPLDEDAVVAGPAITPWQAATQAAARIAADAARAGEAGME